MVRPKGLGGVRPASGIMKRGRQKGIMRFADGGPIDAQSLSMQTPTFMPNLPGIGQSQQKPWWVQLLGGLGGGLTGQEQNQNSPWWANLAGAGALAGLGAMGGAWSNKALAPSAIPANQMTNPYAPKGIVRKAEGGMLPNGQSPEDVQSEQIFMAAYQALQSGANTPESQSAIKAFVSHYGEDALQELMGQMQGGSTQESAAPQSAGLISGPGDGQSDNVPVRMSNGGRAQLSPGEFVVDAHTVSALGNGSTEAGVRKLEAGIRSVRQQKFGSAAQPPKMRSNSNPLFS